MAKACFLVALFLCFVHAVPAAATTCEQQCWLDYDNCGCGDYWSCAACDAARDSCLSYCATNPPPTCPTTRDYTTTNVTRTVGQGGPGYCFLSIAPQPAPKVHSLVRRDLLIRKWRETKSCNGTTTQTLLTTATASNTCWLASTLACSPYYTNTTNYPLCFPY